jgi:phosphoesterase RecJ-like protein
LVTHVDPDGDAIGSLLGLGWILGTQGRSVTLTCEDPVPGLYTWLPGSAQVGPGRNAASLQHDLTISLDCGDLRRTGQAQAPGINLDHHVTNTRFGVVNWVEPSCVATAQMVLMLADALAWEVAQPAALCLLTGIVTDTRGLRTSNVDARVLRAVQRLVEAGAPLGEVAFRTLDQRPLAVFRLWGEAIGRLELEDGILWTEINHAMLQRWSPAEEGMTGLSNFLAGVQEAKIVVVFVERDAGAKIDVGMRAAPGYDVSGIALRLGGGGHPQAAGCTLVGDLAGVKDRVLAECRSSLREQARGERA